MQQSLSLFKFALIIKLSQRIGDRQNSLKISAPLHLIKICQVGTLLTWSISLDSTFKREMLNFSTSAPPGERSFFCRLYKRIFIFFSILGVGQDSLYHHLHTGWRILAPFNRKTERVICLFYSRVLFSEILMHSLFLYKDCTDWINTYLQFSSN